MQAIKFCPKCNQAAPSEKNTFCPYDGTPLIEMHPAQPIAASVQSKPAIVEPSEFLESNELRLDCSACKTPNALKPTTIAKFSGIIRIIGNILLIPSFFGIALAVIVFLTFIFTAGQSTSGKSGGGSFELGFGIVFSFIIGIISLVGGLLGWLLLQTRKVYKCQRCGFILDRA